MHEFSTGRIRLLPVPCERSLLQTLQISHSDVICAPSCYMYMPEFIAVQCMFSSQTRLEVLIYYFG